MNKRIVSYRLFGLFVILLQYVSGYSQYDLKATWNEYEPGTIVNDDPFYGSFTIMNYGETTIPAGDTIWYGYIINGEQYDKELNLGLVSGIVLEEDFYPEEERSIYNPIIWPLWGSGDTLDVCALVFGVGYESYSDDFHTGDLYPENNETCVQAVMPTYTIGLQENEELNIDRVFVKAQQNFIEVTFSHKLHLNCKIEVLDLTGKRVVGNTPIVKGQNKIHLEYPPETPEGIYFVRLSTQKGILTKKFILTSF